MNVDATLSAACRAQLRLVQSMRSANVRAESIVFNRDALSAYARNRPPLWKPVRQMPREMQRWGAVAAAAATVAAAPAAAAAAAAAAPAAAAPAAALVASSQAPVAASRGIAPQSIHAAHRMSPRTSSSTGRSPRCTAEANRTLLHAVQARVSECRGRRLRTARAAASRRLLARLVAHSWPAQAVPPTTVSFCELRTLRRHSALSACERRAARTAWSLSGGGRRALARAAHQGCQAVWLVCSVEYECQRASVVMRSPCYTGTVRA